MCVLISVAGIQVIYPSALVYDEIKYFTGFIILIILSVKRYNYLEGIKK